MTAEHGPGDLQTALLTRARNHAEEIRAHARDTAERIIEDKQAELREREAREQHQAQALAQRLYRQQVESARQKAKGELDRLRWSLAQTILEQAKQRLQEIGADESRYVPMFKQLLKQGVQAAETDSLVAEINERDLTRFKDRWDALTTEAAAGKTIELANEPLACLGGVLVRDPEDRIRIDETFDGRIQRHYHELMRTLMDHLFEDMEAIEDPGHG